MCKTRPCFDPQILELNIHTARLLNSLYPHESRVKVDIPPRRTIALAGQVGLAGPGHNNCTTLYGNVVLMAVLQVRDPARRLYKLTQSWCGVSLYSRAPICVTTT